MTLHGARLLEIQTHLDARGSLGVIENECLPFEVKRVYYLFNVPIGAVRGEHAHRALEQMIIPMHGKVSVHVSDGLNTRDFLLDSPSKVLHLIPGLWRSLKFIDPDSVICVLASREYEPHDYIHDFEEYMKWSSERRATR